VEKELPNFELSGILQEYYGKKKNGIVLKFSEPLDSAVAEPENGDLTWCMFEFKDNELIREEPMNLQGQSAFLLGRDERVCDYIMMHPSISKQHCVV